MKLIKTKELPADRIVECTGCTSHRILLMEDGCGFGMTKTIVPPDGKQMWHYPNHMEACYCVSGHGEITNISTGDSFQINPDTTYVLNHNEPHYFEAFETVTLICVFNPPLVGKETHDKNGTYDVGYVSPVYHVRPVPIDKIVANDYNPNAVAPPEMQLLETSILEDGYTQPVVTVYDQETDTYIVVDGFHRFLILKNSPVIIERENGMLPCVVLNKDISDRMASTIRHNRARGSHNIELMSAIVAELVEMGKGDRWICKHIGMSPDEVLRMKQITGLASLFTNKDFAASWDVEADDYEAGTDIPSLDGMGGDQIQHVGGRTEQKAVNGSGL